MKLSNRCIAWGAVFVLGLLATTLPAGDAFAEKGGKAGTETHFLFLEQGCSVTITCNDDGTHDIDSSGCTKEQTKTILDAAPDICG